jgi:hypothetical protein
LGGNAFCINETNSIGTIKIDNICIETDGLTIEELLETLTTTNGAIIGGAGLGLGAIIGVLLSILKGKKPKK